MASDLAAKLDADIDQFMEELARRQQSNGWHFIIGDFDSPSSR